MEGVKLGIFPSPRVFIQGIARKLYTTTRTSFRSVLHPSTYQSHVSLHLNESAIVAIHYTQIEQKDTRTQVYLRYKLKFPYISIVKILTKVSEGNNAIGSQKRY